MEKGFDDAVILNVIVHSVDEDEGEALDSDNLKDRLNTLSQIITAKVSDDYDYPTLINL